MLRVLLSLWNLNLQPFLEGGSGVITTKDQQILTVFLDS